MYIYKSSYALKEIECQQKGHIPGVFTMALILFLYWKFVEIILVIQFSDKNWNEVDDGKNFALFYVTMNEKAELGSSLLENKSDCIRQNIRHCRKIK